MVTGKYDKDFEIDPETNPPDNGQVQDSNQDDLKSFPQVPIISGCVGNLTLGFRSSRNDIADERFD